MLLNFQELAKKYNIKSEGVIVVGSHVAQEHNDYLAAGIPKMVYIEPCAKAFAELRRRFQYSPNVKLFNMACGDKSETGMIMYTGDNTINKGQSNSLLKPQIHLRIHPEVEFTDTELVDVEMLDNLGISDAAYDFLVMDAQGYEDRVLKGGLKTLEYINWVYTELNMAPVYENCAQSEEIDILLKDFVRVETGSLVGGCWTDGFYVRKTLLQ